VRTGSLRPGESPMRHFANEGHSPVAEMALGFGGDGAESVTLTTVVPEVLLQLVLVPAPGSAAGLLGRATHVARSKRADERNIPQNVTGPRPDVAVKASTSPGTVGGAGASTHVGAFAAGGKP
jgi:hypothetical protein